MLGLVLSSSMVLLAQTASSVDETQIRGRSSITGMVFVTLPSGEVRQATIETEYWELIVVSPFLPPILRPKYPNLPPPTVVTKKVKGERATQVNSNTMDEGRRYKHVHIAILDSLEVYRNGLFQTPGIDYVIDNGDILFVPHYLDPDGSLETLVSVCYEYEVTSGP